MTAVLADHSLFQDLYETEIGITNDCHPFCHVDLVAEVKLLVGGAQPPFGVKRSSQPIATM
jgi:hypothetical protein